MSSTPPPVSPGPGGVGAVKGVAKKWTVKGVDKQPAAAATSAVKAPVPAKVVKTVAAPEAEGEQGAPRAKTAPPPSSPGAPPGTVKKMLAQAGAAAPAPSGEAAKMPLVKAATLRKTPTTATPANDAPPRAATLRESGGPSTRPLGLSKTASRLAAPPTPPGEPKKALNASSPTVPLVRPNKPLPAVGPVSPPVVESPPPVVETTPPLMVESPEEEPPAVPPAFEVEEEGPPPVPAFEQPPPVPAFEQDPVIEEEDGMLDAMFQEIGDAAPAVASAAPPVPAAVAALAAPARESLSDSFLDSVFDAIKPTQPAATGNRRGSVAPPPEPKGDVTDSFLDSVFNMTTAAAAAAAAAPAPVPEEEEPPGEGDEDGDLLGAVIGEIESSANQPRVKTSLALLEEEAEDEQQRASRTGQGRRASATVAPAGPQMRAGIMGSPSVSRPRVKSFAPSAIGAVDTATIRARGSRAQAESTGRADKAMSEAKVRSVMAELKRAGSGIELVGRVLYDMGKTNSPSALRLWGSKALLVVAGDKIHMRTLGGEENLGNIAEAGVKVIFQEPNTDRIWVAGKDPSIKVYELTKPSQPAHLITSHSEWVAAVELYAPGVVATASADKTIRVWKLPSLKSMVCKGHLDFVTCLASVPDPVDDNAPPLLASASCDKTIRLWNLHVSVSQKAPQGQEVRTLFGHTGWVWSICSDGKGSLWSSARDCSLRNWNLRTGECVKELKLESSVTKLVVHDKTLFALDEALVITMLRKGKVFKKLSGHSAKIRCLAFLGDSMFSGGDDKMIRRWNVHSGACIEVLKGHTDSVVDLRAAPEMGRLYSCSDDGTVREWAPAAALDGAVAKVSVNYATRQEVELARLRKLMQDPLYRAASICQAVIRMRFVRDSIRGNRVLMFGAKIRYQNLCNLVTFEQNHLACISQFLTGFLAPMQSFIKRHPSDETAFKVDQVCGFADALHALYVMHSNLLEKLDFEKQTYPFCVETGHILESEQSCGQLYLLLLEFIPILIDWTTSGLDGSRTAFFERVEADQSLRLDHGACRLLLWGVTRYWMQGRLPTMQLLRFTPNNFVSNDAPMLCAALARSHVLDAIVRSTSEASTARARFVHSLQRYIPSDVASVDKKWLTDAGAVLVDEQLQFKVKNKLQPVRLLLTTHALLVFTDTGTPKKDRLVELVPLDSVADALLQVDPKEVAVRVKVVEQHAASERGDKKKLSLSTSGGIGLGTRSIVFAFDNPKRSAQVCKEMEQAVLLATHSLSRRKVEAQAEVFKRVRPAAPAVPEYPAVLVQYLRSLTDESLATVFNFPLSELKIASIADAFDACKDPAQRAAAVSAVLPTAGVHNVFGALVEYFVRLPCGLFDAEARKSLLGATSLTELRSVFSQPTVKVARDLLSYVFWFLGERLLVALQRSDFEDPLMAVAANLLPVVFWEPRELRRMVMDTPRAHAACRLLLSNYEGIFPRVEMPNLLVLDESKLQMEQAKKLAKEKYEAEEQERSRALAEREKLDVEKVKLSSVEAEQARAVKAELDKMVLEQRAEFEQKKQEMLKGKTEGESAFEALRRQQAEAKARANAKLQQMKDKGLGGVAGPTKSLSDASLTSLLSDLGVSAPNSKAATPSPAYSAAATPAVSRGASLSVIPQVREAPMIKIPELQLTPMQQRLIIVIPKLPANLEKF